LRCRVAATRPTAASLAARRAAGAALLGRVLAVGPRPFQLLVRGRLDGAAGVASLPADDLVRLAALLAPRLQLAGPGGIRLDRLAVLPVPEQHLAEAVALHAHRHRRERSRPPLGRAPRLALAVAHALQVVLPQGVGGVA